MKEQILAHLSTSFPWRDRLHVYGSIDSTNDELRRMAKQGAPHGTVVIADTQTGGHGRRGRSFHSPEGMGIYLSCLLRPACAPTELMHLTCAVAVAVCNAVECVCGIRPGIKWTNDLVANKKKLCGILTELGLSPTGIAEYAIIGIGVNCCQQQEDFPEEIRQVAGSLAMAANHPIDRSHVAAAIMEALQKMDEQLLSGKAQILAQYRADCITLQKDIVLVRGDETRHGRALDIDETGALVVRFEDGNIETVSSGEVSVRGMYGYV